MIATLLLPSPHRGEGQPPQAAGRGNARATDGHPRGTRAPSPSLRSAPHFPPPDRGRVGL